MPLGATVATVAVARLCWHRLPDPMASHWSASGQPNGTAGRAAFLVTMVIVVAVVGLGPMALVWSQGGGAVARFLVATGNAISAFIAGLTIAAIQANLDAATWADATPLPGRTVTATVAGTVLAGALGAWAAGGRVDAEPVLHPVSAKPVAQGAAGAWSGRARGRLGPLLLAVILVVVAVSGGLGAFANGVVTLVVVTALTLALVAVALFTAVEVTVDSYGLTVRLGWFGWPRMRVPLDQITDVSIEDVEPMRYGGWGLRTLHGATAIIIRRGEALRVARVRRRVLVVTVDGATQAGEILLGHVHAAR